MQARKKIFTTLARPARLNEEVITVIDGEEETRNTAKPGDWVIIGTKHEEYIISDTKLRERYELAVINHERNEYDYYNVSSKPVIIECEENKVELTFEASWGEEMIAHPGDYLVYENRRLSYRIEREAFFNTYELI